MPFTLEQARLVDARGETAPGRVVVDGDVIRSAGADASSLGRTVDLEGAIVAPGFVDVHTHGGGGYALHTADPEEIAAYARWVASTGVTSFLVGVVGVPGGMPEAQLRTAAEAIAHAGRGARPAGIHLEGPYINPARRGAHDLAWLRRPDPAETARMLELSRGQLRLVTLAPELPGAPAMIRRLLEAGVVVSLGHTEASYEQARAAIALGIRHATHCFNAMPPLLHRAPGPLAAVIEAEEEQVQGELIADGVHVQPPAMRVLARALGVSRTVVVTDAQPAAGLPGASFDFAGQPASIVDGVARLADGTIAGSVLTMDQALRNVVAMLGVSLPQAIGTITRNPARILPHRTGLLEPGHEADLVVLDSELRVQATIVAGRLVYARPEWAERLAWIEP